METREKETIRVRLMLIEALLVQAVATPYVTRGRQDPDFDAVGTMRADVVDWFDILAGQEAYDEHILGREGTRLLGAIQQHVEQRLKRWR